MFRYAAESIARVAGACGESDLPGGEEGDGDEGGGVVAEPSGGVDGSGAGVLGGSVEGATSAEQAIAGNARSAMRKREERVIMSTRHAARSSVAKKSKKASGASHPADLRRRPLGLWFAPMALPIDLVGLVAARLAEARAAHPGVVLSDGDFVEHLERTLAASRRSLDGVRTTELFLACASAKRDPVAIAHLERDTFGEVEAVYRRFPSIGIGLDDVVQRVREKLVLQDPPAIAGYSGMGALRGWVRAAVLHMLLNVAQRETREQPTDDALFDVMIGSDPGAEAAYVKLACRAELEAALAFGMNVLDDRDRCLLRYAFVDGRNIDEIGAIYSVHRATAARWISSARQRLVDLTREDLMRRLGVSETEARSIIAAALSGVGSLLLARLS